MDRNLETVIMAKRRQSLATETVEHSPEGPSGFEPLHLRQASGFAGGLEFGHSGGPDLR
jgi:hypothetical protein